MNALDDLPGERCERACELLRLMRRRPLQWFVAGSPSAEVLLDLAYLGFVTIDYDDSEIVALYRVLEVR